VKLFLSVAATCACVSCHPAAGEHEAPIAVEVRCVAATRQSVDVTEKLYGRVAAPPGGDLPIASQVAGRVVQVLVHEGEQVDSGTIVAVVDDTMARDTYRQTDAAVAQARAAASNADSTLDRTRQLVARGIAAKQELDDAVARAEQAHAALTGFAAASDIARRTLGRVQVRSSFDGFVTRVWRGPGALVDGTAATPIAQLAAAKLAELDADATGRQLVDIVPGEDARVTLATGGDPIHGVVRARTMALDPATGLGLVRIGLDAVEPPVLGTFGMATVTVRKRDGVFVVPAAAMRGAVADGAEVVVCGADKADVRFVQVGWRDDMRVEIVKGVKEGERVAVDHVLGLEKGTPIAEVR
jgi:RND family efflux transporter MFP subunit